MKSKVIAVLSAVVISIASVGGAVYAFSANEGTQANNQQSLVDKQNEYMNNLSEEDFQKMIELMKENGYESMAQMMESVGREGMINMHNSMSSMHGEGTDMSSMHTGGSGMMGGFASVPY